MKRLIVIMVLWLAGCELLDAGNLRPDKLRALSFDICPVEGSGHSNSWAKRKDACLAMLEDISPDVAFLQRVSPVQADAVRNAVSGMYWTYNEGLLFLCNDKKFAVEESGFVPLGDAQGLQWARLRLKKGGRELYCFNVLLSPVDAASRRRAAGLLVQHIRSISGGRSHVLAGGSFYEEAGAYNLAHLRSWMKNAREEAKTSDETQTYNAFRKYGHITTDHLFYRNAKALQYQVVSDSYGVPFISDHYPCFVNLVLDGTDFPQEDEFDPSAVPEDTPDSLALWNALKWVQVDSVSAWATAQVRLFSYPQTVSVVKYALRHHCTGVALAANGQNRTTSALAKKQGARFAVNAGFFDPRTETPLTYAKVDGEERSDNNTVAFRYAGLILCGDGAVKIMPCNTGTYKDDASSWRDALASGPLLLLDGNTVPHDDNPTYKAVAPRSCFGYDDDGNGYFLVVDGRFDRLATGLTFDQLALLARYLGMRNAINLDGGGSSTLWVSDVEVVNHPYDNKVYDHGGQREVNSIIFAK